MSQLTRREFGKAITAAGMATALDSSRVLGANDRINVGIIGCGGRGQQVWPVFLRQPDVNPVAVCDVYEPFLQKGIALAGGKAASHKDFRQLLDRKDIDVVIIATPDHWHAMQAVSACRAGKDVYVEKPLSLFVREGRVIVKEARKHRRVVQVGSQQRSGAHYARAVKLIQDGMIGKVHKVSAGFTRNIMPGFVAKDLPSGPTPALDWNLWLGPAPYVPFDPFRCIYNFRWFWDYSGGQMTNWGAHNLDIARWVLKAAAPLSVAGFGRRYELKDGGETPDVQEVVYDFPDSVVSWSTREINQGREMPLEFHGTLATLSLTRTGFRVVPELWKGTMEGQQPPAIQLITDPGSEFEEAHVRNFLDCVKTRQRPNADVEEGHRSAAMCHLGNIATRLGRSLKWDAEKEEIVGDPEANRWLSRPYRAPWVLGG